MRRVLVVALLLLGGWSVAASQGQRTPEKRVRDIQNVRDNLYFISGGDTFEVGRHTFTGGNVAVFVTTTGVVLVDTMDPGLGEGILAQVRKVTDKPVTMIINTHTHRDHSGSNTEFPDPVEIVAHEATRASMALTTCQPVTNCDAFKGENEKYLPQTTFEDKLSLGNGKDQIDLYYFGRGHTDGDAWVVFPAARAMHAGDMFARKYMPAVVFTNNGSATEYAQTLNRAVNEIQNVDTVIGGHTPIPVTWLDFQDFVDFYNDFVSYVQQGKEAGENADQVASAYTVPARYNGYFADPGRVRSNVEALFDGR